MTKHGIAVKKGQMRTNISRWDDGYCKPKQGIYLRVETDMAQELYRSRSIIREEEFNTPSGSWGRRVKPWSRVGTIERK